MQEPRGLRRFSPARTKPAAPGTGGRRKGPGDGAGGRGWTALNPDGTLKGRSYFHLGDDSAFRAEQFNKAVR